LPRSGSWFFHPLPKIDTLGKLLFEWVFGATLRLLYDAAIN